jgi:catechol 2,3-dioxygenase-like lactoylglutathione lyase family enzyme
MLHTTNKNISNVNNYNMNLNQITVPVLDIEKSISFYQMLGLNLIVRSLPNYARFVCPEGNATFSLHKVDQLSTGEGIWIYFEVENVEIKIKELVEKDIIIESHPEDKPWLWREASLKDLDNNKIIIYHAGENRLNPPWRI